MLLEPALSSDDEEAYGDLYQWGRYAEGHESRGSDTTFNKATTALPNGGNYWDGLFIVTGSIIDPEGWLVPQNDSLWQGIGGINNPCPPGFRIPTSSEWNEERNSWSSNNSLGAFNSPLKLTSSGFRFRFNGSIYAVGGDGYYWSSTLINSEARYLYFYGNSAYIDQGNHANGCTVRCIKEESASNHPPDQSSNPSPQNGATNISTDTTLSWSCSDPDGDDLTYNIYFGTEVNPPLIEVNYVDTFYNPGTLLNDTTYFWKIVAYDTPGDSTAGDIWSFSTIEQSSWSCGDPFIDDRDGQSYNTVQIGTQCWMAENLNIGILLTGFNNQTDNGVIEKYCYSGYEFNCDDYGGLYQWNEMMEYITLEGSQGICPFGWYVPTDEEWKQLEGEVDSQYNYPDPEWNTIGSRGFDAGINLKSSSGWYSSGNGTNLYNFTGLPGGYRSTSFSFYNLEKFGHFWTSNEDDSSNAFYRNLNYSSNSVWRYYTPKGTSYSVRCIKDE
ncbi:MAG: FISUMP domain-containing protein [Bacteroidales bacterium]